MWVEWVNEAATWEMHFIENLQHSDAFFLANWDFKFAPDQVIRKTLREETMPMATE